MSRPRQSMALASTTRRLRRPLSLPSDTRCGASSARSQVTSIESRCILVSRGCPCTTPMAIFTFTRCLSFRGHCYVTTYRGDVMMVDLRGPRMVYCLSQAKTVSFKTAAYSYLVRSQGHKMLMLARNAVYLNHYAQKLYHLGIYHFEDKRISLPRELARYAHGELLHCACHRDLADYLIFDIERRHCPFFASQ
ncbi:hypothetical protein U9M48_008986, partial [Paspalum notatum var. saurae]